MMRMLIMSLCLVPSIAMSEEIMQWMVEGVEYSYMVENGEAVITSGEKGKAAVPDDLPGIVAIPRSVGEDAAAVRRIGDYAFYLRTNMTSVTIHGNVSEIGTYAFASCSNITSIVLEEGIKDIGDCAFRDCVNLRSAVIPNSVTNIGEGAFAECGSLEMLVIGDGVTEIKGGRQWDSETGNPLVLSCYNVPFYHCTSLREVIIGKNVKEIGAGAFKDCPNLKSLILPDGLEKILPGAFSHCESLESVRFGSKLRILGSKAFEWTGLVSVEIPASVEVIGYECFSNCRNLKAVDLPDKGALTDMNTRCFAGCASLETMIIPDTVSTLEIGAFYGCSSLRRCVVGDGVRLLPGYDNIWVTYLDRGLFSGCSSLEEVVLGESVDTIVYLAFYGCGNLSKIIFTGNAAPTATQGEKTFKDVRADCRILVTRSSTGWGVDIPGTWNGLHIAYVDEEVFPELPDNASLSDVTMALDGSADAVLLANVTNASQYTSFRTWVLSATNEVTTAQVVKYSDMAWLSYALGAERLITNKIASDDVHVARFGMDASLSAFTLEVEIDGVNIGGGSVAEAVLKENLRKVLGIEGATRLDPADFSSDNIGISFDAPVDGKARFTVLPSCNVGGTYFMRVKIGQ